MTDHLTQARLDVRYWADRLWELGHKPLSTERDVENLAYARASFKAALHELEMEVGQ